MVWCVYQCVKRKPNRFFRGLFTSLCCVYRITCCVMRVYLCVMFVHKPLKIAAKAIIHFFLLSSFVHPFYATSFSNFTCTDVCMYVSACVWWNKTVILFIGTNGIAISWGFSSFMSISIYMRVHLHYKKCVCAHDFKCTLRCWLLGFILWTVFAAVSSHFKKFAMNFIVALLCCIHIHRLHEINI